MKNIGWKAKTLIVLVLLIIGLIGSYFYLKNNLEKTDQQIIENELNKDSDGKGYSDLGAKKLEYYSEIYKPYLSPEDFEDFRKFYILSMQYKRKTSLAKNKEDFLYNYEKEIKVFQCLSPILLKIPMTIWEKTNMLGDHDYDGETNKTADYQEILFIKYEPNFKRRFEIINPEVTDSDCQSFKNEKNN